MCCKTWQKGWQLVKVGLTNYSSSSIPWGQRNLQSNLLVLFTSSYFWHDRMSNPTNISQVWQTPTDGCLDFSLVLFICLRGNAPATAYQRPQTYIMKLNCASTTIKPHLQYQHSILQIIHSLLWNLPTIRNLPGDWGNGSIWAFQTHSQGAVLVRPVRQPRCAVSPPEIRTLQQRVSIHIER